MKSDYKFFTIVALLLMIIALLVFRKDAGMTGVLLPEGNAETTVNTGLPKKEPNSRNVDAGNKTATSKDIAALTAEAVVVPFVKKNGRLPDYYITKQEARSLGWIAAEGNLCDALPGRAIGGDIFSNRQRKLPSSRERVWYEADLNYDCGRRNADRLVFSNDGLVYVTHDHYQTFDKQ